MADEPRRSGRATKGQYTKDRDIPEEKAPAKGKKAKGKKTASEETEPEENEAIIRCICGATEDEEGLMMVSCDECEAWQHNLCMGVTEVEDELPDSYYCERCAPRQHAELLAAIKRGEKPWETKKKQREEEDKAKKKGRKGKKGKGGGAKPRPSDVTATPGGPDSSMVESPAKPAAKAETGNKRKLEEDDVQDNQDAQPPEDVQDSPLLQKRRKSSHHAVDSAIGDQRQSTTARRESAVGLMAGSIEELSGTRQKVADALSKEFVKIINASTKEGSFRIPDGHTPSSLGANIALQIEHGMFGVAAPEDKAYSEKFRTIKFNIGKNKTLAARILKGSLQPDELATMSSDDMASEELQKKMATMKEEADKQSILIQEEGPRIRKTHKGEEIIDDTSAAKPSDEAMFAPPPIRRRTTEDVDVKDSDGAVDSGHTVELPEDVGVRRPLTINTGPGSSPPTHTRRESNFNINEVWGAVHSPEHGARGFQQPPPRRSSIMDPESSAPPQSAIVDDDVDRLLNDDDPMDMGPQLPDDPESIWSGNMAMASVGEFLCYAKWAAGGDPSSYIPWTRLFPQNFEVSGRIPVASANDYISNMRFSSRGTDVSVVSLHPAHSERDEAVFSAICNYFTTRARWGVLATGHEDKLKDAYLIPVEPSSGGLPNFLDYLDHKQNVIPKDRSEKMLLVVVVVRGPTPPPSADTSPLVSSDTNAPRGAPPQPTPPSSSGAPGQPQFSPVVQQGPMDAAAAAAAAAAAPATNHALPPLAARILGEFANTRTVQMMMNSVPDMNENQLINLRDVLEKAPETRNDVIALSAHLRARSGGE